MQQTALPKTPQHGGLPAGRQGFAHPRRNVAAFQIAPGMTVVDFGAGSGAYTLEIAERLSHSGHVYAVDIQQDLLRRIKNEAHKRGYQNVEIIWSDVELPRGSKIADDHADLVLISNLVFQVADKKSVLEEAARILKNNGRLAIIDWTDSHGGLGPHKRDVVKKEAARTLAEAAGFQHESDFNAGAHHYGLILRKKRL